MKAQIKIGTPFVYLSLVGNAYGTNLGLEITELFELLVPVASDEPTPPLMRKVHVELHPTALGEVRIRKVPHKNKLSFVIEWEAERVDEKEYTQSIACALVDYVYSELGVQIHSWCALERWRSAQRTIVDATGVPELTHYTNLLRYLTVHGEWYVDVLESNGVLYGYVNSEFVAYSLWGGYPLSEDILHIAEELASQRVVHRSFRNHPTKKLTERQVEILTSVNHTLVR